jgi:D-serine deaminase-like pyridoxal phosphate-dependent protein
MDKLMETIETPVLVVDMNALERNIAKMAEKCGGTTHLWVEVDVGMKVCSVEFGLPEIKDALGVSVGSLPEEHENLVDDDDLLRYRQKIEFLPGHGCTTVNLHDKLFCVRDGILEDVWKISGCGKSR